MKSLRDYESRFPREELRLTAPLLVQLEITKKCGNNCEFCYNFWEHGAGKYPKSTGYAEDLKVREAFDVLVRYEVPAVCFTGGEPFEAEELLFYLLGRADENGVYNGEYTREIYNS